jgi:hypothetical protein
MHEKLMGGVGLWCLVPLSNWSACIKLGKWTKRSCMYMYVWVSDINFFLCFYNISVGSQNCADSVEYTSPWVGFELTTLVVICTDCTGSCKSNCNTITTETARNWLPWYNLNTITPPPPINFSCILLW